MRERDGHGSQEEERRAQRCEAACEDCGSDSSTNQATAIRVGETHRRVEMRAEGGFH